ncbi:uncharacterized protein DNG_08511 [Cephalotrichum gorgonifer]|uniref:Uncharacterized protein n=1 Tax=Cephalotrichum gorgonifer TaxID=2041049 RepID=A0AAE8N592_9PEZI|nr:uncharacterized protein DNG_08511 [Cephalotrichum gorgonifer]
MEAWEDRSSGRSTSSYSSTSTAPTSVDSSRIPTRVPKGAPSSHKKPSGNAVSHPTTYYESSSRDTFDSTLDSDDESSDDSYGDDSRIPQLPVYRKAVLGPTVQPSNYRTFPDLFPSLDRMLIRHDEFTSDGNMNLRVDTQLPHRPQRIVQLFHLRMYDLDARIFSLRRYCRESGREVCRAKREYSSGTSEGRKSLQRSVSSVFKSLGARPQFRRQNSTSTLFSSKSGHSDKRPDSSLSMRSRKHDDYISTSPHAKHESKIKATPTDTIKLMFTNYATIEVMRRGGGSASKRYDFEWWGRRYSWRRIYNENLNTTSFHLVSDGRQDFFLGNIVPDVRSPNELTCDELDGGWMPPCTMWFSRELDATLAEVYVATGLIALVDDCIRQRWDPKKESRLSGLRV